MHLSSILFMDDAGNRVVGYETVGLAYCGEGRLHQYEWCRDHDVD